MQKFLLVFVFLLTGFFAFCQDEEKGEEKEKEPFLEISGSADMYYKYDVSSSANIQTIFAEEQNSISIGMLDLVFTKEVGKASFVGEVAFGPRSANYAGPAPVDSSGARLYLPRIQDLHISYNLTEKLTVSGGYMATFIGYEVFSPVGNKNYSTTYLFTNFPFQNAGVKLDYEVNDRFAVMAGVFNSPNLYTADPDLGVNNIGTQIYVSPVKDWDVYINLLTEMSGESGRNFADLTTTFEVSEKFRVGLNAAIVSDRVSEDTLSSSFSGAALYLSYGLSESFSLTLRSEYFSESFASDVLMKGAEANVVALTLSGNFTKGAFKFIPEIRYDGASEDIFVDSDGAATGSAVQVLGAAIFEF